MSDVTDLKAEVLLLRKENKELRELVRGHVGSNQNAQAHQLRATAAVW